MFELEVGFLLVGDFLAAAFLGFVATLTVLRLRSSELSESFGRLGACVLMAGSGTAGTGMNLR